MTKDTSRPSTHALPPSPSLSPRHIPSTNLAHGHWALSKEVGGGGDADLAAPVAPADFEARGAAAPADGLDIVPVGGVVVRRGGTVPVGEAAAGPPVLAVEPEEDGDLAGWGKGESLWEAHT